MAVPFNPTLFSYRLDVSNKGYQNDVKKCRQLDIKHTFCNNKTSLNDVL